jgi:hypothetical protein
VEGDKGGGGEKGGEMTQTLYAHMNKIKIFKKRRKGVRRRERERERDPNTTLRNSSYRQSAVTLSSHFILIKLVIFKA